MPASLNNPLKYDATLFGPGQKRQGVLIETGMYLHESQNQSVGSNRHRWLVAWVGGLGLSICLLGSLLLWRKRN